MRNVAFVGHGGAGKTTLSDAILFCTTTVSRFGRVDDETSAFDFEPEEQKRKTLISAAVGYIEWKKTKINLIDTSGNGNFLVYTRVALHVVDAAVVVVSASDGVQVYTERTWANWKNWACRAACSSPSWIASAPIFRAHPRGRAGDVVEHGCGHPYPHRPGSGFHGAGRPALDEGHPFPGRGPGDRDPRDPGRAGRRGQEGARGAGGSPWPARTTRSPRSTSTRARSPTKISHGGFAQAVRRHALVPVLAGAPGVGFGIQPLLDFIVDAFPSPAEHAAWKGTLDGQPAERVPEPTQPVAAYVWKTVNSDIGRLSILRILSGKLTGDTDLISVNHDGKERIGQLYAMQGKGRVGLAEAFPADTVAVAN